MINWIEKYQTGKKLWKKEASYEPETDTYEAKYSLPEVRVAAPNLTVAKVVREGRDKFGKDFVLPAIKAVGSLTPIGAIIGFGDAYKAWQEGNTGWAIAGAGLEALPYAGKIVGKGIKQGIKDINKVISKDIRPAVASNILNKSKLNKQLANNLYVNRIIEEELIGPNSFYKGFSPELPNGVKRINQWGVNYIQHNGRVYNVAEFGGKREGFRLIDDTYQFMPYPNDKYPIKSRLKSQKKYNVSDINKPILDDNYYYYNTTKDNIDDWIIHNDKGIMPKKGTWWRKGEPYKAMDARDMLDPIVPGGRHVFAKQSALENFLGKPLDQHIELLGTIEQRGILPKGGITITPTPESSLSEIKGVKTFTHNPITGTLERGIFQNKNGGTIPKAQEGVKIQVDRRNWLQRTNDRIQTAYNKNKPQLLKDFPITDIPGMMVEYVTGHSKDPDAGLAMVNPVGKVKANQVDDLIKELSNVGAIKRPLSNLRAVAKEAKQNMLDYIEDPAILETAARNTALGKRIGLRSPGIFKEGKFVPKTITEYRRLHSNTPMTIGWGKDLPISVAATHHLELLEPTNIGRVKANFKKYGFLSKTDDTLNKIVDDDLLGTLEHEVGHHFRIGNTPIEQLKTEKLLKSQRELKSIAENNPELNLFDKSDVFYLDQPGELSMNLKDLAKDLKIPVNYPYIGYDKMQKIHQYDGPKKFVLDALKLDTKRDYKRVWDALTGKYIMIPSGIVGGSMYMNNEINK